MKKILTIISLLLFSQTHAQQFGSIYETKNHPKAKGNWIQVKYPVGWKKAEGDRPNIVQKFTGDYQGLFVMLALQVLDAKGPVEKECKSMTTKEFEEALSDKESSTFAMNAKKISHEYKPAFIYDMKSTVQRSGITFNGMHRIMTVCHKNSLISLWCSPSKIDASNNFFQTTSKELSTVDNLCFQFFNSMVLMDNYR